MLDHRENVHRARLRAGLIVNQLDKTNQAIPKECSDEDTTIEKCRLSLVNSLEVFSVMRESPSLTHGAFVVNLPDSAD